MKEKHRNLINQRVVAVPGIETETPATRQVNGKTTDLKISASGGRFLDSLKNNAERDNATRLANEVVARSPHNVSMVWDFHFGIGLGEIEEISPGVADEDAIKAWRKGRGLPAASTSLPAVKND
jgi:hypothetical protein